MRRAASTTAHTRGRATLSAGALAPVEWSRFMAVGPRATHSSNDRNEARRSLPCTPPNANPLVPTPTLPPTARGPKAGSFVRPKKVTRGVALAAAIRARYEHQSAPEDAHVTLHDADFNAVDVEVVNGAKIENRVKQLDRLMEAVVAGDDVGDVPPGDLRQLVPRLKALDLSQNLVCEWATVADIGRGAPNLRSLVLKCVDGVVDFFFSRLSAVVIFILPSSCAASFLFLPSPTPQPQSNGAGACGQGRGVGWAGLCVPPATAHLQHGHHLAHGASDRCLALPANTHARAHARRSRHCSRSSHSPTPFASPKCRASASRRHRRSWKSCTCARTSSNRFPGSKENTFLRASGTYPFPTTRPRLTLFRPFRPQHAGRAWRAAWHAAAAAQALEFVRQPHLLLARRASACLLRCAHYEYRGLFWPGLARRQSRALCPTPYCCPTPHCTRCASWRRCPAWRRCCSTATSWATGPRICPCRRSRVFPLWRLATTRYPRGRRSAALASWDVRCDDGRCLLVRFRLPLSPPSLCLLQSHYCAHCRHSRQGAAHSQQQAWTGPPRVRGAEACHCPPAKCVQGPTTDGTTCPPRPSPLCSRVTAAPCISAPTDVESLNGSSVTPRERLVAERFFLEHFSSVRSAAASTQKTRARSVRLDTLVTRCFLLPLPFPVCLAVPRSTMPPPRARPLRRSTPDSPSTRCWSPATAPRRRPSPSAPTRSRWALESGSLMAARATTDSQPLPPQGPSPAHRGQSRPRPGDRV